MATHVNDTNDEQYLPWLGVTLQPGESVDYLADDEVAEPEPPVVEDKPKPKATLKTDPAPEPADIPAVPADTQES